MSRNMKRCPLFVSKKCDGKSRPYGVSYCQHADYHVEVNSCKGPGMYCRRSESCVSVDEREKPPTTPEAAALVEAVDEFRKMRDDFPEKISSGYAYAVKNKLMNALQRWRDSLPEREVKDNE